MFRLSLSEDEKLNLKPGADGKIHIANNGIFNDEAASAKYAAQNGSAQGVQYYIYFPEADNSLSELLVAGYQKSLENDFMGLTNATQETKGFMLQYGQQGLELDGHSRGSMTVGNAMESLMKRDDAKGLLSGTTISFFGPAYNVFKADDELNYLQNREVVSNDAQRQSMVLTFENHVADPVGRWIGGNPSTGGSIPVGSSWVQENMNVFSGSGNTAHNCYGRGVPFCKQYWSNSPNDKTLVIPVHNNISFDK